MPSSSRRLAVAACLLLGTGLASPASGGAARSVPHGRLETLQGYAVLSLDGTPQQMGTACGRLLGPIIQRVIRDLITDGIGSDPEAYRNMLAGSRVMEAYQPEAYRAELKALAEAAGVAYPDLLLLQYFGDVRRCIDGAGSSPLCTAIAMLPPLTRDDACLVARNLDYFDHGVGEYASLLVHYRPKGKIPFVTVTWAGIINGWTLLNARGVVTANNTPFGAQSQSLRGVSTCFLLRQVAEHATTVNEALEIVRKAKRACGTNMLVASGRPPDAAVIEFDHERLVVRRPREGFLGAANHFELLNADRPPATSPPEGRVGAAFAAAQAAAGKLDLSVNVAGAEGVPIVGMNLHSAMIDATHLRLRLAIGAIPACHRPYRAFRFTTEGLTAGLSGEPAPTPRGAAGPPAPAPAPPEMDFSDYLALVMGVLMVGFVGITVVRLVRTALTGERPTALFDEPSREDTHWR